MQITFDALQQPGLRGRLVESYKIITGKD